MDDLVQIYTAPNKSIADLIKGFLESNGIKTLIQPAHNDGGIPYSPAIAFGSWKIYVFKEKEEEAKKLIEDYEKKD